MRKTLVILDPELKDFRGHFFNYDSAMAKAATGGFDRVRVACSTGFDEASRYGFEPVFRDPERFWFVRILRRLTGMTIERAEARIGMSEPVCNWRGGFLNRSFRRFRSSLFARDLAGALSSEDKESGETHVFLQADPAALEALDLLSRGDKLRLENTLFHVLLRNEPVFQCRRFEPPEAFAERLVRLAGGRSPRACLYTDTRGLADAYAVLTGSAATFTVLPIPLFMPDVAPSGRPKQGDDVRLGVMGVPRREKGFLLLPDLARILPAKLGGKRAVLQVQIDPHARDSAIVGVEAELKRLAASASGPEIRLWSGSADPDEYAAWCSSADISVLLHNSPRYRLSSSSVLIESLHLGIPVVAFSGTWLAGVIADSTSAGLTIGETVDAAAAIPAAVETLTRDLDRRSKDAAEYYRRWKEANSPERLIEILLKAGTV